MPRLRIPDEYAPGLALLLSLPDGAVNELTQALTEAQGSLDVRNATAIASSVSEKITSIPTKDLRRILASILSLYSVQISSDMPTEQFLDDVVLALKKSRKPELAEPISNSEIELRFRNRLKTLFQARAFTLTMKAVAIQHEHEHTLCTLRIFTDARPVYGEEITRPSAVAITHMLKLTYHEGNEIKEMHVAFDKEDLTTLKAQIVRAESKAASLRALLEAAKILVIE